MGITIHLTAKFNKAAKKKCISPFKKATDKIRRERKSELKK
jgi:hypothetical protein